MAGCASRKDVKLPDNQQDRDMLARELLIKFQMSPRHPMVELNRAYRKFLKRQLCRTAQAGKFPAAIRLPRHLVAAQQWGRLMDRFSVHVRQHNQQLSGLPPQQALAEAKKLIEHEITRWASNPDFAQLIHFCENGTVSDVKAVLDSRVRGYFNLNAAGQDGRTPLGVAVEHNNLELVNFLLARGADPCAPNRFGRSPYEESKENPAVRKALDDDYAEQFKMHATDIERLVRGLYRGSLKENLKLLEFGIVKPSTSAGELKMTPLLAAVQWGSLQEVATLIGHGAGMYHRAANGESPYETAVKNNATAIIELFEYVNNSYRQEPARAPVKPTSPHDADEKSPLLSKNSNRKKPDAPAPSSELEIRLGMFDVHPTIGPAQQPQEATLTPLAIAKTIIENEINRWANDDDFAKLIHCCKTGNLNKFKMTFLSKQSGYFNINAAGQDGKIPLGVAVENGHLKMVKFLISASVGADACSPNRFGETPFKRKRPKKQSQRSTKHCLMTIGTSCARRGFGRGFSYRG